MSRIILICSKSDYVLIQDKGFTFLCHSSYNNGYWTPLAKAFILHYKKEAPHGIEETDIDLHIIKYDITQEKCSCKTTII